MPCRHLAHTKAWQQRRLAAGLCKRCGKPNDRKPKQLCSECQAKHSAAGRRANRKRDRPTLKELKPLRRLRQRAAHLVLQLDRWGVPMPAGLASTVAEVRSLSGGGECGGRP